MNARLPLLLSGLMVLAPTAIAQAPVQSPLLAGGGKGTISPQTVEAIRTLVRMLALPEDSARLWVLHRDGSPSNGSDKAAVYIDVYLWPQVFTSRLVRGATVSCTSDTAGNSSFPESPVVGGWSLSDRRPASYALVAALEQPFTTAKSFDHPFRIFGELADEDVVAVADCVAQTAPDQRILDMKVVAADHVHVLGQSVGRTPDGHRARDLEFDFNKSGARWNKTRSGKWYF